MKEKFFLPALLLVVSLLAISSCQKSITETKDEVAAKSLPDEMLKNQCKLTHMALEGFDFRFHYNSKGLADEWRIDYGTGIPDVYTMEYNNDNHLTRAWYHYDGELQSTIDFEWTGNLLTKENWDYSGFLFDVVNTYNIKGEMTGREVSYGYSIVSEHSPNGNAPIRDIFFDGELFYRGEYTFNQANKNPFLAIRGIPYGFPFLTFEFTKWWETSEKQTYYFDGDPFVVLDEDPAQTSVQFGFQNYLSGVTHFDVVSNSNIPFGFEYQNCGPEGNAPTRTNSSPAQQQPNFGTRVKKALPLKMGSPEMLRKQLQQRRK
jgi:hypothetical protein